MNQLHYILDLVLTTWLGGALVYSWVLRKQARSFYEAMKSLASDAAAGRVCKSLHKQSNEDFVRQVLLKNQKPPN